MKPHIHAELIHAWANGEQIQHLAISGEWVDNRSPFWNDTCEYRIKPVPKQDVVQLCRAIISDVDGFVVWQTTSPNIRPNLKLVYDGETRELKSAEVIK